MAAHGELVQEAGGREEGEEDMDMDDEATFLRLDEFALTGHQSSAFDHHDDEEKDNTEDGEWIHGRQLVAAVEASHRGDAASEALGKVGPAAMLRTLVRKLRRRKAAGPGYPSASGGRAVAALEDGNRGFMAKGEVQQEAARRPGGGAVTSDSAEQWTPTTAEAALKYLSNMPVLACRRGMGDGPDGTSPPHHLPETTMTTRVLPLPVPGRRSRGETGLRQACKRLGISRSSVAASPPPTPQRRDDSLLQAQDGIASAIAYCKLSLTTSKGFESSKVSFRA